MGKKIDLNTRRTNNSNNFRKSNHNFNHYNNSIDQPSSNVDDSLNTGINSGTRFRIPRSNYELPKSANIIIKLPLTIKITLTILVVFLPLVFLLFFVALFSDDEELENYLALAGKCSTVTVVNTGCDENGENCTNKYDGEVDFEDYIAGVVAAEAGSSPNDLEYYKVVAITARTYFFDNFQSDCQVSGNINYQSYIDVEDSQASSIIKQAVDATKGLVIVKDDEIFIGDYSKACVVYSNNESYYIRYGNLTLEDVNIQKIPKEWDMTSAYSGLLAKYYSQLDKNDNDYYNIECPSSNNDYGMSLVGALYLITEENYSYEKIIHYYYGEDAEIKNMNIATSAIVDGFINPVNNASCTDSFGCRYHPINKKYEFHQAIDLGASSGESIYAAKSGTIEEVVKTIPGSSITSTYGNYVLINHGDNTKTRYAHMLYGSIPSNITVGATVEQGDMIGKVGATGSATGPHLHYEIYVNNSYQNPFYYLDLSNIGNSGNCNTYENTPLSACGQ